MITMASAYSQGWNDFLDGHGWDDNPWTECSDKGQDWCAGYMGAERKVDEVGADNVERAK